MTKLIKIIWKDREIGRLENEYENYLYPLLEQGYIALKSYLDTDISELSTFSPIYINVRVFLYKSAFTEPITKVI